MDLVRRIALAMADHQGLDPLTTIEGVAPIVFAAHAQWMDEAGLVDAKWPGKETGARPQMLAGILRLTWAGCEFVDAVRSDSLWKKAKEKVIKPSASWTFGVLLDWLKTEIQQQIG